MIEHLKLERQVLSCAKLSLESAESFIRERGRLAVGGHLRTVSDSAQQIDSFIDSLVHARSALAAAALAASESIAALASASTTVDGQLAGSLGRSVVTESGLR